MSVQAIGQVYSFSNAGATGSYGPTGAQLNNAYTGTNLENKVRVGLRGHQIWEVPADGLYEIRAQGARSAGAGKGAVITAKFYLFAGEELIIVVGQAGGSQQGGGGGTFIVASSNNDAPLVVAGGGGGSGNAKNNAPGSGNGGVMTTPPSMSGAGGGGFLAKVNGIYQQMVLEVILFLTEVTEVAGVGDSVVAVVKQQFIHTTLEAEADIVEETLLVMAVLLTYRLRLKEHLPRHTLVKVKLMAKR